MLNILYTVMMQAMHRLGDSVMCDGEEIASKAEAVARSVLRAAPQGPHCALLVPGNADLQAAKAAYRRLSMLLHPDKCTGSTLAADAFKAVSTAYKQVQALAAGSATEAVHAGRAADRSRWTDFAACTEASREAFCSAAQGAGAGNGTSCLRRQPPEAQGPLLSASRWAAPLLEAPAAMLSSEKKPASAAKGRGRPVCAGRPGLCGSQDTAAAALSDEMVLLRSLLPCPVPHAGRSRGASHPITEHCEGVHARPGRGRGESASQTLPSGELAAELRWAASAARRQGSPEPAAEALSGQRRLRRRPRVLVLSSSSSSSGAGASTSSSPRVEHSTPACSTCASQRPCSESPCPLGGSPADSAAAARARGAAAKADGAQAAGAQAPRGRLRRAAGGLSAGVVRGRRRGRRFGRPSSAARRLALTLVPV